MNYFVALKLKIFNFCVIWISGDLCEWAFCHAKYIFAFNDCRATEHMFLTSISSRKFYTSVSRIWESRSVSVFSRRIYGSQGCGYEVYINVEISFFARINIFRISIENVNIILGNINGLINMILDFWVYQYY